MPSPDDPGAGAAAAATPTPGGPGASPSANGSVGTGKGQPKRDPGAPSGYSYGDKGSSATAILAGGGPRASNGGGGGHRKAAVASNAAVATYPGFAMRDDGGSTVFVQLTKPVDVEEHKAAGVVTYLLKGAHVVHRNNENALVTVHFNTPVTRARLTDTKKGLALVIELRGDATPTYKIEAAEGASRLVVDFPSGNFIDANGDPLGGASGASMAGGSSSTNSQGTMQSSTTNTTAKSGRSGRHRGSRRASSSSTSSDSTMP